MKLLSTLFTLIIFLIPSPSHATADGPDYFAVKDVRSDDVLNIRSQPDHTSQKIGEIPHDGRGITNLGCIGGAGLAEWMMMNEAEKEESKNSRWCHIQYSGIEGYVAGRYLKEDMGGYDSENSPQEAREPLHNEAISNVKDPTSNAPENAQELKDDLAMAYQSHGALKIIYDIGEKYGDYVLVRQGEMRFADQYLGDIRNKILKIYPSIETDKIKEMALGDIKGLGDEYERLILADADEEYFGGVYQIYMRASLAMESLNDKYSN